MRNILFARPDELDRLAKFFGDGDSLANIFLDRRAAAKTAAKQMLMEYDLRACGTPAA